MDEQMSNYKILGVAENTDKDTVEKKYGALVRQYKQHTDEYGATNEDVAYYNKITKAYNEIMGITGDYSDMDPTNIIPYSIRKKWSKFSAFFDSYKLLIFGFLFVVIIGLLTYMQLRQSAGEDIYVKFVGAFNSGYSESEEGYIDRQIADKSAVIKQPLVSYFTVVDGETSLLDTAAKNAAVQFRGEAMAGSLDVILIDKENLDVYTKDLFFLCLDDFLEEHKDEPAFQNLNLYRYENKGGNDKVQSGVYAIEISDMDFFSGMNIEWRYPKERRTMYLAIGRLSKRMDISKAFASEIILTNKKTAAG